MKRALEKDKFQFIGKSLYFPERKMLALADLHIGYEEYLNKLGIFLPRMQFKEIMKELEEIFEGVGEINKEKENKEINKIKKIDKDREREDKKIEKINKENKRKNEKIEKIVVAGDLKHEFGQISSQEWRETKEVLEFFKKKAKKVILVKGNHDNILAPIASRKELKIKEFYVDGEICFLHGNKMFNECLDKKIKLLVIGHRHPAVVLSDKYKREKYKCFLVGNWKGKKVIILPSFFPFIEGSDIVEDRYNKLFVDEKSLKNFDVWIVGDKVYRFGKLRGII